MERIKSDSGPCKSRIEELPKSEEMKIIFGFSFSALGFMIGLAIYLLFRESTNVVYQLFAVTGASPFLDSLRESLSPCPAWFILSLPDGLWMFSFSLVMVTIWRFERSREAILWYSVTLCIGVLQELMQSVAFLPGQFDPLDLACLIIAALIPLSFTHKVPDP